MRVSESQSPELEPRSYARSRRLFQMRPPSQARRGGWRVRGSPSARREARSRHRVEYYQNDNSSSSLRYLYLASRDKRKAGGSTAQGAEALRWGRRLRFPAGGQLWGQLDSRWLASPPSKMFRDIVWTCSQGRRDTQRVDPAGRVELWRQLIAGDKLPRSIKTRARRYRNPAPQAAQAPPSRALLGGHDRRIN